MRLVLLSAAITLAFLNYSILKADERFLLIPSHTWSDGTTHIEYLKYFKSYDWEVKSAHAKCAEYAKWLHDSRISAPMYSSCVDPSQLHWIRR